MLKNYEKYEDEIRQGLAADGRGERQPKKASAFGDERTKFLWRPYLPIGDYTVLMADGGTGKTILCCGIAADVSRGRKLPDDHFNDAEPGNVLIISAEDSGEQLKARLKGADADLDKVFILDRTDSEGLTFEDDVFDSMLAACMPALVVIDPWHAFAGSSVDISRANVLRPILQRISVLAKKFACAVILVSHQNKRPQGENSNHSALGSVDFINAARSALRVVFAEDNEDSRILVHTKSNYARAGRSVVYTISDDGAMYWDGFSDIDRKALEEAARRRISPKNAFSCVTQEDNQRLIDAIKGYGRFGQSTKVSFSKFREDNGKDIFAGRQPVKALNDIKPQLDALGIVIRTKKVKNQTAGEGRGIEITFSKS